MVIGFRKVNVVYLYTIKITNKKFKDIWNKDILDNIYYKNINKNIFLITILYKMNINIKTQTSSNYSIHIIYLI